MLSMRSPDWPKVRRRIKEFITSQFLLVSFLLALTVALAAPQPGRAVGSVTIAGDVRLVQTINIMIVFFISGLVLRTDDLRIALRYKLGVAWGFVSTLGITPCLGFAFRAVPLNPSAFAAGLTVMCAVPTTLGIGLSLVRSCKGNEGLALLLTVGTNLAGIVTMPFFLKALFSGSDLQVHVDILDVFVKLVITVLAPSVFGKVLREISKAVQRFSARFKVELGLFSTANLAFIVWIALSGARDDLFHQKFVDVVYVALLAVGQHLAYLAFNFSVVWFLLRMPVPEAIAAGIMSSQKSAPVAYTAISYITSDAAQQGLMAIPALVSQLSQVFIGSALVPFLSKRAAAWRQQQQTLQLVTTAACASPSSTTGPAGQDRDGGSEGGGSPKLSASVREKSVCSEASGKGVQGRAGQELPSEDIA